MVAWILRCTKLGARASAKNVKLHRTLGTAAFVLMPIIVVSGMPAAMIAGARLWPAGQPPVDGQLAFTGTLFIMLIMIDAYVALGTAWRCDAQQHKRLMLFAAIALVEVAEFSVAVPVHACAPQHGALRDGAVPRSHVCVGPGLAPQTA